jgi:hypothetical protein
MAEPQVSWIGSIVSHHFSEHRLGINQLQQSDGKRGFAGSEDFDQP